MGGYYSQIRQAKENGDDVALYIKNRIKELEESIKEYKKKYHKQTKPINAVFIALNYERAYEEIAFLKRFKEKNPNDDKISTEDIEHARSFPINELVDMQGHRCIAFCHDSDSHSMSYNEKTNTLHCFVCHKTFNPIDVLIERDGYSFIDAVRRLS
jgi:DNA primase